MALVHTFRLGNLTCHAIDAGGFKLDGGAMFGVVPKPLWSKRIAADDQNRIQLALRCLLVEHPDGLVLIDTGVGNKEDPKFLATYGIDNAVAGGRTRLESAFQSLGHSPADVAWVINTHLHFDHAGGNTYVESGGDGVSVGGPRLTFPNATYVTQWGELEFARNLNERTRASYMAANFEPVAEAGKWKLLRGDVDVLPGISVWVTPGHVPYHQSVVLKSDKETLVYLADLMPTSHHLGFPWIMGYDLEPLKTLESKRRLLRIAEDEGWWFFFEHDAEVIMGRLGSDDRGPALADVVRVSPAAFEGV